MKSKIYIHYGSKGFDKKLFTKIKNRPYWVKPFGGLWASDINAKYGWVDWNKDEDFVECNLNNSFMFKLKNPEKILTIDSEKKLLELPRIESIYDFGNICLDFEKLSEEYDAIEVLISNGEGLYRALYGWDCDSLLVLNPESIIEL